MPNGHAVQMIYMAYLYLKYIYVPYNNHIFIIVDMISVIYDVCIYLCFIVFVQGFFLYAE